MPIPRPKTIVEEMDEQAWNLWKHNPITASFFTYLDDLIASWRETGADLLEAGAFNGISDHPDRNPDVVRGRLLAVRDLQRIELADIKGFYGQTEPQEDTDG